MNTKVLIMRLFWLLSTAISLYNLAIIVRIILSWLPSQNSRSYNMYGQEIPSYHPFKDFLTKITDPYLNFFRRKELTLGRIDWSPLIALMVLNILKSLCDIIAGYGTISVAIIIVVILQNLWSYLGSYIILAIVIMLGVRYFLSRRPYGADPVVLNTLDNILYRPVQIIYNLFYRKKGVSDQTLTLVSFFCYLGLHIGVRILLSRLVGLLLQA